VLDNHSAHISKETRAFLATLPNRFEFTFTPKHGSWLNLIESFFGKMAKTLLRGIRVASADELKARIELYLKEVNETPGGVPMEVQIGKSLGCLTIAMLFQKRSTRLTAFALAVLQNSSQNTPVSQGSCAKRNAEQI
jgi:hypothetical protein